MSTEGSMKDDATRGDLQGYLERWGMLFELLGATRMMGKILAWLLVSDPPEQSAGDIAQAVGASAGSVSTTTRALTQAGMVERVGIPGERSAHFRVRSGVWGQLLRKRMSYIVSMRDLVEEGLEFSAGEKEDSSLRLRELGSYCSFIERELPAFIARWEKDWEKERQR
jgi:DNA-binding transcriptional regulator GbsR (MarR family)